MLTAVGGYYNGTGIVMDEPVPMSIGQRVIITIMETQELPNAKPSLSKYMARGPKMFNDAANDYVKDLRTDDRV